MRKPISLFIVFVLMFILLPAGSTQAATPVSYESSIQIRNLTGTAGTITMSFYNLSGTVVGTAPDSILANETKSYYQSTMPVAAGFNGSVVVSSDVPTAAMSNLVGRDGANVPISYAAFSAFDEGSVKVYLPTLFKDNYGYNTFYYVQNLGSTDANVSIQYSDGKTASLTGIKPSSSQVVRQSGETHPVKVFSATLTGTQPIAVTVVEEGSTLFAYSGFGPGSTNPIMPLVNENNYGFFTGVQIQNTGAAATNVTVTYSPSLAGSPCTETRSIPAGGSKTFAQYVFYNVESTTDSSLATTCVRGQTFVGSAKVTGNSASQPLVGVVNQLQPGDNKGGAYGAFDPASGQSQIIYPLIMDRNYGYFTSWSIVNVGTGPIAADAITCQVTGKDSSGTSVSKVFKNPAIPVDASWTLNHQNQVANGFVGGATCTGPTGTKLIGTSNQLGAGAAWTARDTLLVSEGFLVNPAP